MQTIHISLKKSSTLCFVCSLFNLVMSYLKWISKRSAYLGSLHKVDCGVVSLQILPNGDLRPQAKHLQTRTEYLLKILRKQIGETETTKAKVILFLFILKKFVQQLIKKLVSIL